VVTFAYLDCLSDCYIRMGLVLFERRPVSNLVRLFLIEPNSDFLRDDESLLLVAVSCLLRRFVGDGDRFREPLLGDGGDFIVLLR
jgi:hypothetical protein